MSLLKKSILLGATFGVAATLAFAASDGPTPQQRAIEARQSKMTLYAFNLGLLGGMAKGDIEYDAQAAGLAAKNLAALTTVYMPGA
jgi:cytochrome c556